jgi:manganese transport protein
MSDVLEGKRRGVRASLLFFGPAVVASIAYMDPGNFATNIQGGARYGYELLWVVVFANLVAMLFQALAARVGIVTGQSLPELCRAHFRPPVVWAMWILGEVAAMATDLAEFLGGAIGLSLLLGLPLAAGMVVTAVATYVVLALDRGGFRPLELAIGAFVALIALSYLVELLIVPVDWRAAARGAIDPRLADAGAVTLAVGIVGATVMPHAIYLHSGLVQSRAPVKNDAGRRLLLRYSNIEVVAALSLAGLVNLAMVVVAAGAFHDGHPEVAEIETAYQTLSPLFGAGAAAVFLTSLIASGLSSSVVGTMAGQMIMQGFVGFRVPVWLRRAVTMLPAIVVVALGVDATSALVGSQVVLSLVLPVPMIALLIFANRADIMGPWRGGVVLRVAAIAAAAVVLGLNCLLVAQTLGFAIPGLAAD